MRAVDLSIDYSKNTYEYKIYPLDKTILCMDKTIFDKTSNTDERYLNSHRSLVLILRNRWKV